MKILYILPILLMLAGASCQHKPNITTPNYPANSLAECPEIQELIIDESIGGTKLEFEFLAKLNQNKQYADCATIHNKLVRFIKEQQPTK